MARNCAAARHGASDELAPTGKGRAVLLMALISLIVLGAVFEFARALILYALVWLLPIGAAMATLQFVLAHRPGDAALQFWSVVVAALVTRCAIDLLASAVRRLAP